MITRLGHRCSLDYRDKRQEQARLMTEGSFVKRMADLLPNFAFLRGGLDSATMTPMRRVRPGFWGLSTAKPPLAIRDKNHKLRKTPDRTARWEFAIKNKTRGRFDIMPSRLLSELPPALSKNQDNTV